jgi:gamma-glutamylcyclotransferase (GGCT)/AIG2-like uncharacterized protein YtfP
MNRLFVYGTLAPGQPNEHIVSGLDGTWQPGSVRGDLKQIGWGANMGYPGLVLNHQGDHIRGLVLTTHKLADFWGELDAFEGAEYQRVITSVEMDSGETIEAYVYALSADVLNQFK